MVHRGLTTNSCQRADAVCVRCNDTLLGLFGTFHLFPEEMSLLWGGWPPLATTPIDTPPPQVTPPSPPSPGSVSNGMGLSE